jgi:hypothetical protein
MVLRSGRSGRIGKTGNPGTKIQLQALDGCDLLDVPRRTKIFFWSKELLE